MERKTKADIAWLALGAVTLFIGGIESYSCGRKSRNEEITRLEEQVTDLTYENCVASNYVDFASRNLSEQALERARDREYESFCHNYVKDLEKQKKNLRR